MAACDSSHYGTGPSEGDPGEVCAGGCSAARGQREGRQTLDPSGFPARPHHLRVDLQTHGVRRLSHKTTDLVSSMWQKPKCGVRHVKLTALCICSTRPWDPEVCLVQFEKDRVIQTHEKGLRQPNGISFSHSWASHRKVKLELPCQQSITDYMKVFFYLIFSAVILKHLKSIFI